LGKNGLYDDDDPLYLPSHTVRFPLDKKQNLGRHVTHACFFASQKEIPKFLHNP
jgi:hypothetical protein